MKLLIQPFIGTPISDLDWMMINLATIAVVVIVITYRTIRG